MIPKSLLRLFSFFFLLLTAGASQAQIIVIRVGEHPRSQTLRNWRPTAPPAETSVASEAPRYVSEIMQTIGLKPNFEVRSAPVDNAAAVVYGGKRYILYNPDFIEALVRRTGSKWAAVSVLAHEIGHHLDGHTVIASGSQPQLELEADEFSGYVLRKMGASLADAQAAMRSLASARASRTHPARNERLASIARGWNRADGSAGSAAIAARPAPVHPQPAIADPQTLRTRPPLDERFVLGDLTFHADRGARYYVTTRYNVVKVDGNGLQVLGKVARSNNSTFPYVIYDEETRLYVHADGTVLSAQGKAVGRLTARA